MGRKKEKESDRHGEEIERVRKGLTGEKKNERLREVSGEERKQRSGKWNKLFLQVSGGSPLVTKYFTTTLSILVLDP